MFRTFNNRNFRIFTADEYTNKNTFKFKTSLLNLLSQIFACNAEEQ